MRPPQQQFILHIEDDEDDRSMLKEAVNQIDPSSHVWGAKDGPEGLEILMQCNLMNQLPQLIILDLNLPGMDGKVVLKEIKKEKTLASIPLVILTTSSGEMDKMFADKEGVPLFTKPLSEADFFLIVKAIIESCYRSKEG